MIDMELFVDYLITLTPEGRVVVKNLCTGDLKTFTSMTPAVDWAASHTNTISPRYPKGYRSQTVRLLEELGATIKENLLAIGLVHGENIEYDSTEIETEPEYISELQHLRRESQEHMRNALEADTSTEENGFLTRAADLHAAADALERHYAAADIQERKKNGGDRSDPWKHITGRSSRHAGHTGKHSQEEHDGSGRKRTSNAGFSMADVTAAG